MKASAGTIILFLALLAVALVIPPSEASAVHQAAGEGRCLDCHAWLPLNDSSPPFQEEVGPTCIGCHGDYHGKAKGLSHPVNISPSMAVPRDMLLDSKGRITCVTCHTFHTGYKDADGKKLFFLRRSMGKPFCYSCHKKPLF
jgi:hypothetical protein